jgi:imidazolonepropionase-like amidohydrolase
MGSELVNGLMASFHTDPGTDLIQDNLLEEDLGLLVTLGVPARKPSSLRQSQSGQLSLLRQQLTLAQTNSSDSSEVFVKVVRRLVPLVVRTNSVDDIAQLLRLQAEFVPPFRLSIVGGAEAHLAADRLAAANVSVILSPARCSPGKWTSRRCAEDGLERLLTAGVRVGLAVGSGNSDRVRNLRWELGIAQRRFHLTDADTLALGTRRIAEATGQNDCAGALRVGCEANMVVTTEHPFGMRSEVQFVMRGRTVECAPRQFGFASYEAALGR